VKLVDMKLSKEEAKKSGMVLPSIAGKANKGPEYPWGLEINLETEAIEKLGIDFDTMRVGKEYTITAVCEVTSVSESENRSETSKSMRLQIKKMAAEKGKFDRYHELKKGGPG